MEDRYRFIRLLGEGAMGEVYLAEHVALGRQEAVKILRPVLAMDQHFVSAFRREARATNRVQHPNIVAVYDFGKLSDGRLYLAMEFADGVRLDHLLADEAPLNVARALPILVQLADAVGHAHAHGVVHRDLKPGNLILTDHRGQADFVKVLDFGMAKILAPEAGDVNLSFSRVGDVFGTPKYMAPEQFLGRGVDGRADVYAIGCIAYEMLTGRPPFDGRRMELVDAHIAKQPVPMRGHVKDLPVALDEAILRCLEKAPEKRHASAHELKQALERLIAPRGKSSHRSAPTLHIPAATAAPKNDFETADTGIGDPVSRSAQSPQTERQLRPLADDEPVDEDFEAVRAKLLRVAETLLDRDHSSAELIFAVVEVKEAEQDRVKLEQSLAEVGHHLDAVEQDAREREAALRFAIADLEFERGQQIGGADLTPVDLGPRMQKLKEKLARVMHQREQDIGRFTEQSVALTAELAKLEDRLGALYGLLDLAVSQGISRPSR